MSYTDFFKRATRTVEQPNGLKPFPYQCRLAEEPWPELLDVPTGMGKTAAVVLAWLWKRGWREGRRELDPDAGTPRRLVYCLPMRVLVEQTERNACRWLENFAVAGMPGQNKVSVHLLMGGSEDVKEATWAEHPEEDMVIVGTQDMLLSAALNRAYATYPSMWPVHFGLLNVDALWVMDEVQLMGPGRTSSVQLQHFFETEGRKAKDGELTLKRRTLWMSATLGEAKSVEQKKSTKSERAKKTEKSSEPAEWLLTPEIKEAGRKFDLRRPEESELDANRLRAPKLLNWQNTWNAESSELHQAIIAEAVQKPGRQVLVFVNTVPRARSLHEKLREQCQNREDIDGDDILLLHSRFRLCDRREKVDALFQKSIRSKIVVTTQVLEAGADLDMDALFTEIAPWPSLVQRLGRLNRKGLKPSEREVKQDKKKPARAVIFDVPVAEESQAAKGQGKGQRREKKQSSGDSDDRKYAPYDHASVKDAHEKLQTILKEHTGDLSPRVLRKIPSKIEAEGPVLRRFHLRDDLFPTDADLSGGYTDVARYVRAIGPEVDCYVLWRELASDKNPNALSAAEQPPIHRGELCAVPFYEAKEAFKDKPVWILAYSLEGRRRTAVWRKANARDIQAGDTVMVSLDYGCYDDDRGWLGGDGVQDLPQSWVTREPDEKGNPARVWRSRQGRSEVIDHHVDGEFGLEGEPRSFWKRHARDWMTLGDHLDRARSQARGLVDAVGLSSPLADWIEEADLWHDLGKALERKKHENGDSTWERPFQRMLRHAGERHGGHPAEGVLYAKSKPKQNGTGGHSAGFRHEVASALAYLKQAADPNALRISLITYLILAHHGKVRVMPAPWGDERMDDWNGVRPGDRIAEVMLPDGSKLWSEEAVLDLEMFLPTSRCPGWQGRVADLLDHYGPFYLAYLEALVRIADWRAS